MKNRLSVLVSAVALLSACSDGGSGGDVPRFVGEGMADTRPAVGVSELPAGEAGNSTVSGDSSVTPSGVDEGPPDVGGVVGPAGSGSPAVTDAPTEPAAAPVTPPLTASPELALPRSSPEAQGVRSSGVLALVDALDAQINEVHSLMLVRHGSVVAEGWWAPYQPDNVHVLYSVSKSFNSTAVGMAADEGLLSIDDLVLSHFPDLAPAQPAAQMQNMRIRHLLTMGTGHQNDTMDTLRQRADGQWTRAFLETNVENPPGSPFVYNSGASYMLASIVQRLTGMTVEDYLEPRLFAPLGITQHIWGQSPEGVNLAGGGLAVTTEAMAKFGQLYLQRGQWQGQQLLSAEWVDAASSAQISTGNNDGNWNYGYGYQFWRNAGAGYRADGSLGQFTFILPEQDAVLVITSATNDTDRVMNLVWEHLLPAFAAEAALPPDAAAQQQLAARLTGLALPLPQGAIDSPTAQQVSGQRFAVGGNNQGIAGLRLDFSGATPTLTVEDATGVHAIALGLGGQWVQGRTAFKPSINELFETPEQAIAGSGAWEAPDTFVAKLAFNETPYVLTSRFRFQGTQVFVDMSYNIRWGNATEPQLVGNR